MEEEEKKKNIFTTESIDNRDYRDLFGEIGNCGMREWVKEEDGTNVPDLKHPLYPPPYLRLDFRHLFKFLRVRAGTRRRKLQLAIDNSSIEWETFRQGCNRNVSNEVVTTGICTAAQFLKIPLISLLAQLLEDCENKKIRLSSYREYEKVIERFLQDAPHLVEQSQATTPPPFSQGNQEHSSGQTVAKMWSGYKPVTGEEKWLDPNNHQQLPLRGRRDEFNRLNEFIEADGQFKVWAIAGPSGAGKTRLVSEWSTTSPKLTGWHCRVLHKEDRAESDPDKWVRESSAKQILIIIDYMYGFEKVIQKLMENRFKPTSPKIRLLVIDHVFSEDLNKDKRWGLTGNQSSYNQNEDYFFKLNPLDLRQTQEEIIRSIIACRANLDQKSNRLDNANKYLLGLKEQGAYHPLFAALVGDAIRSGKDFTAWNRRELIDYYLSGNDRLPWEHGTKRGRWASHFVAVATARRKMTYDDLFKVGSKFKAAPKDFEKVKKICQKVISDDKESTLFPFQPDILGESFFLKFLQSLKTSPEYQEEFRQVFMAGNEETQIKDAAEFIAFIQRLTRNLLNDDQNAAETQALWKALFDFMTPSNFEDAERIEWAVSAGLIDIVDAIQGRFPENELVSLLNKVEPAVLYHDTNDNSLTDSVVHSMRYFELIHRGAEPRPVLSEEMFALLNRYTATSVDGEPPLILASYSRLNKLIEALIERNVNIEVMDSYGQTALMFASLVGYTDTVKCLLKGQANIHATNIDGVTALIYASVNGHTDTVKLLLNEEAKVDRPTKDGATALIMASFSGHTEAVRLLLDKGAKIDIATNNGNTALVWASSNGHTDTVGLLLDKGAKIDIGDNDGITALITASVSGHVETVRLLLGKGAKTDIADNDGRTALMYACVNGHMETVKLLLDEGANVHAADNRGRTGLFYARLNNHLAVVKILLNQKASFDAEEVVRLLIERFAQN